MVDTFVCCWDIDFERVDIVLDYVVRRAAGLGRMVDLLGIDLGRDLENNFQLFVDF